MGLYSQVKDKYNVSKCEEPFIRIKLILQFHKDCNFSG